MLKIDHVNCRMGTHNERRFSNGNIYPVCALPFGMAHFTFQTDGERGNWFFDPRSHTFEGLRLTHQPSPWVGDYGHMLFLPYTGELPPADGRASSYRPACAVMRPDRLEATLQRYELTLRFSPSERGGILRLEGEDNVRLMLLPFAPASFRLEGKTITGNMEGGSYWGFKTLREYFSIVCSAEPVCALPLENGGMSLVFGTNCVEIAVAASFLSEEQAARNYGRELAGKTFGTLASEACARWEELLSRVEVSGEDPARTDTFYTCMYRALLYPRVFHEFDETGAPVHYNADTGRAERGVFYTDNGFWDTYRTVYPFLSLVMPERVKEIAEGILNYAEETGFLPKWLSPGDICMMPGTLAESVLADACVKGILTGDLLVRAYRAAKKSAYSLGDGKHGRRGNGEYMSLGYVPDSYGESVNHTCDCAYGDFCVAQIARLAGDGKTAEELFRRSKNYRNLFDPVSKFLRGKDGAGNFRPSFDPFEWGGDNCEGSSWQNSFSVYHDVEGLAALYGGKAALEARLDELFAAPPVFRVGSYGQEIHEMSEMACADFGQCAISNQPSFHLPWMYTLLGRRDKAAHWVKRLADEAFSCTDEGFPGDEDNGTTACWYLFACMGFYPLCPGKAEYVAATPLFSEVRINGNLVSAAGDLIDHALLVTK